MKSLLVLSGGHPYEAQPFEELIHSLGDWDVSHLVHPEAEAQVAAGAADVADAVLFYDMGGYSFKDGRVETRAPSEGFRIAIKRRFAAGKGAVAMHHAIAGWALWPRWHEWLGGRFFYQPGQWQGREQPDSGYRHEVNYTAVSDTEHPVLNGLPQRFDICDELYLCPIDETAVTPLIRASGYEFVAENFYSAARAVAGEMFSRDGWEHARGSNLVGWEAQADNAPLIYLQFGDGPETYSNPFVRRALANALDYIAGEKA